MQVIISALSVFNTHLSCIMFQWCCMIHTNMSYSIFYDIINVIFYWYVCNTYLWKLSYLMLTTIWCTLKYYTTHNVIFQISNYYMCITCVNTSYKWCMLICVVVFIVNINYCVHNTLDDLLCHIMLTKVYHIIWYV